MKTLSLQETQAISGGSVEFVAVATIVTTAALLGALSTPPYYSPVVVYDSYPSYGYYDYGYGYYDSGYYDVVICDQWGCY